VLCEEIAKFNEILLLSSTFISLQLSRDRRGVVGLFSPPGDISYAELCNSHLLLIAPMIY
jgi:hypothetical protein